MKNYHDEARAMKDLQKFLANPVLLFKIHYTQIKDIILEMIRKLATQVFMKEYSTRLVLSEAG